MRIPVAGLLVALACSACATRTSLSCNRDEQFAIQDTLFFGTIQPDGPVTPGQWAAFVEMTVTPRFPEGLTVTEGRGQWRNANGTVVREATHVLLLVHPDDPAHEARIFEIVAAYKTQFRQEAVLRVRTGACTSF